MDNSVPIKEEQSKIVAKDSGISVISVNVSENNLSEIDFKRNLFNKNSSMVTANFSDPNCKSFFKAIYESNIEELNLFFNNDTIRPWEWIDEECYTCLHRACFLNLDLVIKMIFQLMNDRMVSKEEIEILVNKSSINGSRAIHFASYRGNIESIKILIENGADIKVINEKGLDVLHMAAQGDQPGPLVYFKEKYNLNIFSKDNLGSTPLHWSCYSGTESYLSFLLSYRDDKSIKFEINVQDYQGLTPLHLAVISEKSKIVKKLLFQGADHNLRDYRSRTPYLLAVEKKKNTIAELLKDEDDCPCNFNCLMRSNFEKTERSKTNMLLFIILHLLIENSTFFFILPHYGQYFLSILFLTLFVFVMLLFIFLNWSNPGYEGYNLTDYRQNDSNFQSKKILLDLAEKSVALDDYCPYCIIIKNERNRTKHCYYCNRCIKEFDHHCFWVNNCIGANNVNLFFVFITFVLLNLILQIYIGLGAFLINHRETPLIGGYKIKNHNYNKLHNFYLPPYFEFFKKFDIYDNNIKNILCSILSIISLCFFIPISYLWMKNVKSLCLRIRKKKKEKLEVTKKLQETILDEEGQFLVKSGKE